jgi:pyruvate kinase
MLEERRPTQSWRSSPDYAHHSKPRGGVLDHRARPDCAARSGPAPVIVLTPLVETARRLALTWGLHCVTTEDAHDLDDVVDRAARIAFQEGFAKPGDRIVVTAGVPLGTPGSTNLLRVAFVGPTNG